MPAPRNVCYVLLTDYGPWSSGDVVSTLYLTLVAAARGTDVATLLAAGTIRLATPTEALFPLPLPAHLDAVLTPHLGPEAYVELRENAAPPAAPTGRQRLFIDPADHTLKLVNAGGTVAGIAGSDADPTATTSAVGLSKPDGTSITIAGDGTLSALFTGYTGVTGSPQGDLTLGGTLLVEGTNETDSRIKVTASVGQVQPFATFYGTDGHIKFNVALDGELLTNDDVIAMGAVVAHESVTAWGVSLQSTQPVLATGAGHSADDVITFLQALGFCKQA